VLSTPPGPLSDKTDMSPDLRPILKLRVPVIGHGEAVKIGENFGLRVLQIGDAHQRVQAMSANHTDVDASKDSRND